MNSISNVGKTASMSMLTLLIKVFIEGKVQHLSCWQNCFYEYAYSL